MTDERRICAACDAPMEFFPSEEGSEVSGIWECTTKECEMFGHQQPTVDGHSIASFRRDGTLALIRKGAISDNESNLPKVAERLKQAIPDRFQIGVVNVASAREESGVDLEVTCAVCGTIRAIQVARAVDSEFARRASDGIIYWTRYELAAISSRVASIVSRKTSRYAPADIATRVLALDAGVEVFGSALLGLLPSIRKATPSTGWLSVLLVAPELSLVIHGRAPEHWCLRLGNAEANSRASQREHAPEGPLRGQQVK